MTLYARFLKNATIRRLENHMNRRSKFTRLISSLLTLVMLFSTIPTTAYASVIGDGGGDEGFSGGGNWRANWLENQIGVRVSII